MNKLAITAAVAVVSTASTAGAATYFEAVSADNPVSWFRFSGDLTDSGSGDNDATNNGITFGPAATGFTTNGGDSLGQYAIDTNTAFGDLGDRNASSSLLRDIAGASGVTVEAWIDFDSVTTSGNFLFIPTTGNQAQVAVTANTNGTVNFGGRAQNSGSFESQTAAVGGTAGDYGVRHVVGVFDYAGNAIRVYVDGSLAATRANSFTASAMLAPTFATTSGPNISIGRAADTATGSQFAGNFDELAVYNRALSLVEIQEHYNAAVPEPTAALSIIGGMGLLGLRRRGR